MTLLAARHAANWNSHWDRGHDHYWHGNRCHFHNGCWFVYAPLLWYPYDYGYGYDYYPYEPYYSGEYYDNGSYGDTQAPPHQDSKDSYRNEPQHESDSRVNEIQSALAREGYYDGAIDGHMGPGTRRALRRYQANHGLEATGNIDRSVIDALHLG